MASPSDGPIEPLVPETHRKSRLRMLGIFLVVSWVVIKLVYGMIVEGLGLDVIEDLTTLPVWYPALQVLSVLVEEQVRLQEAEIIGIRVGEDELNNTLRRVAKN